MKARSLTRNVTPVPTVPERPVVRTHAADPGPYPFPDQYYGLNRLVRTYWFVGSPWKACPNCGKGLARTNQKPEAEGPILMGLKFRNAGGELKQADRRVWGMEIIRVYGGSVRATAHCDGCLTKLTTDVL